MAYLKGYMVPPEVADTFTGTCTTAAGTAAKAITVQDTFTLKAGAVICVKFTNTNTASNPTFKVNNGEAKSIWYNTAVITTGSLGMAGTANKYSTYIFDGTNWVWLSQGNDSNTTYTLPKFGIGYGINEESASTLMRSVTIDNFVRTVGGIVTVKFKYGVMHESNQVSKLNVQNTGSAEIYYRGAQIPNGIINAGDTVTFVYGSNGKYNVVAIDSGPEIIENVVAPREQTTSVEARSAGDEFIIGDVLYKALMDFAAGTALTDTGETPNIEAVGSIVSQIVNNSTVVKRAARVSNCNNIVYETGIRFYYMEGNSQNAPTTYAATLICIAVSSTGIYQICINDSANYIYIRQYRIDAWTDWKQIYPTKYKRANKKMTDYVTTPANSYKTATIDCSDIVASDETIISASVKSTESYDVIPIFWQVSQRSVYVECRNISNVDRSGKWEVSIIYTKGSLTTPT